MAYCPRCGTANPAGVARCPLCDTPLPVFDDEVPSPPAWPPATGSGPARVWPTPRQRVSRAFVLVTLLLLFPALTVTGVDVLLFGRVTWSWIPDLSLVGLWAFVAAVFAWRRRPLLLLAALAALAAAVVVTAEALSTGRWGWSWSVGLPLVAWLWALLTALALWWRLGRAPGWNLFGHLCWGAAATCGFVEALLRWTHLVGDGISWSAIVALVLVPVGLLFEVLHYALGRRLNLRQSFHL